MGGARTPGGVRGGAGGSPLIRVCDLAGRPRGTGFLADAEGTLVTSHEAVDGLARLVLHAPGDQVCLVEAEAVTPLPAYGLALVATVGLDVPALPIAPAGPAHPEGRVRLRLPQPVDGTVTGTCGATYTATDRFHLLDEVYALALDGAGLTAAGAQGVPSPASGAPVADAATGAVLGVVVTALHSGHRCAALAVPLRTDESGPLAEVLARNAATVPAHGPHLNLAGALRLTAASVGTPAAGPWREPVTRPGPAEALAAFLDDQGPAAPLVLALTGEPGSGRTTELAAFALQRTRGPRPAPTVWVRGAELRPGDGSVRDAVERSLRDAARTVGAGDLVPSGAHGLSDAVAGLARGCGRPLTVVLDAPEEMPPVLAHDLPEWTARTAAWLHTAGVRLVLGCRPELWEQMGELLPPEMLYGTRAPGGRPLPPCVRLGDLRPGEAALARARYGLPEGSVREEDARHPLTLRLLAEVRRALGETAAPPPGEEPVGGVRVEGAAPVEGRLVGAGGAGGAGGPTEDFGRAVVPAGSAAPGEEAPSRGEIFGAYLDLVSLRIATRLAAGAVPPETGPGVRRLAARVAGRVHEAARHCLGPGQGEVDREAFEALFPWRTGWAAAVLGEGLLVPAGAGYRFAHEEFADWLQSLHLDLPTALHALVHRWTPAAGRPAPPAPGGEAPVRLPSRPGGRAGHPPPVPAAPPVAPAAYPRSLPVPRHRAGPVVQALRAAPEPARAVHLRALAEALECGAPPPRAPAPRRVGPVAAPEPGGDLDTETVPMPRTTADVRPGESPGATLRRREAQWWAAHLLREALLAAPDARPYRETLRALAESIVVRSVAAGGFAREPLGGLAAFGPWFWRRLPLPAAERLDLLRLLLPADAPPGGHGGSGAAGGAGGSGAGAACSGAAGAFGGAGDLGGAGDSGSAGGLSRAGALGGAGRSGRGGAQGSHGEPGGERFLTAVARLLRDDPAVGVPAVCGWLRDDRPLQGGPFGAEPAMGPLTVATAAQALLYTQCGRTPDAVTEALVAAGHPAADTVLRALAEDAPGAICRAVDRWAHDARPERHTAAAVYGARAAARTRSADDREHLRYAALAILARSEDEALHTAALGILVRDPATRVRYLPAALRRFAAADQGLEAAAVASALPTHPELVLDAFRARLQAGQGTEPDISRLPAQPGGRPSTGVPRARRAEEARTPGVRRRAAPPDSPAAPRGRGPATHDAGDVLAALADIRDPALSRRVADFVRQHLRHHPESAPYVAHYLDLRLEGGPETRAHVLPWAAALLRDQPPTVRAALLPVLAAPGTARSRPLRQELLDAALDFERDPDVLAALLGAAARCAPARHPLLTRDLVHRLALLLTRTPEGATRFDRTVVGLAADHPFFARLLRSWVDDAPWESLLGPSARRGLTSAAPAPAGIKPAPAPTGLKSTG